MKSLNQKTLCRINLKWKNKIHLPVNREILKMWPAGKNNDNKIKSDITEVQRWLCTDRLRRDGWVCMEGSDLLRGERFTGLKKQWTKMTRDLSDWLTQIFSPEAETRLLSEWAYKWHCWATEGKGSLKNKTFISDYIPQNTLNHRDFAVQSVSHWIVHKKT